jgi:hypothetical protein
MRRARNASVAIFRGAVLLLSGSLCGLTIQVAQAAPQAGSTSLAEAARQAHTDKKPVSTAKVWTNENLPTDSNAVSVVGQPPPPPPAPAGDAAKSDATAPKTGTAPAPDAAKSDATKDDAKAGETNDPAKKQLELEVALDQAKQDLDRLQKELDLAQRDYSLQQQQFLTNANASEDTDGQAHLAEVKGQIDAKQQEVEKAQAHVAELQTKVDELHKENGDQQP